MGLTRRNVLLLIPLAAILCAPLYAHLLPPTPIPFFIWWEAGCIAFAALFAWRVYGSR